MPSVRLKHINKTTHCRMIQDMYRMVSITPPLKASPKPAYSQKLRLATFAVDDSGNAVTENGNSNDENIEEAVKNGNMNQLKDDSNSIEEKPIKNVPKIEKSVITSKSCVITDLEDKNE